MENRRFLVVRHENTIQWSPFQTFRFVKFQEYFLVNFSPLDNTIAVIVWAKKILYLFLMNNTPYSHTTYQTNK